VIRRLALAATLAVIVLALAACGERKEVTSAPGIQRFDLELDFFPNADHAGIYAAIADGDFRRAGLDVRPQAPSDPAAPLKLLAAGRADLAISYEPELLLARDRGLKLVSVGALVQRPLTSIISVAPHRITSAGQLEGRKVGTAGIPYQSAYLQTILTRAGVDPKHVKEINVGFNLVPAMLSGRVDATLGGFWNYEGLQLKRKHKHPAVIPVDRAGVPTYDELILVARQSDVRTHGAQIRRFLQALAHGQLALRRNPETGVRPLLAANKDLDRGLQLASVRATLPAFFPSGANKPFGYQDPRQWEAYGNWMYAHHLVKRPPDAVAAMTNEFLPGEGV
jgi:putative hydroxymethylpyrimidine transport system substrate-binding protein